MVPTTNPAKIGFTDQSGLGAGHGPIGATGRSDRVDGDTWSRESKASLERQSEGVWHPATDRPALTAPRLGHSRLGIGAPGRERRDR